MSISTVTALPMYSRSSLALSDIRDAMLKRPPQLDEMKGGWASIDNHKSNLRTVGLAPPKSDPVIEQATDELPERLCARFYFWETPPPGFKDRDDYNPLEFRRLAATDVIVTRQGPDHIGILWSSRNLSALGRKDGPVRSLEEILQTEDSGIRVDRTGSHLQLEDTDLFLWLAVQQRDNPLISPDIRLDNVSGISGRDASYRTAELRSGIDFDRPNFLTAVAESDTLGPIEISFVQYVGTSTRSFNAKVHFDGGLEINKNEVHIPGIIDADELMVSTTQILAFSLIPRINELYVQDGPNWIVRREEVIEQAMQDLETRYKSMRAVLVSKKRAKP